MTNESVVLRNVG